MERVEVDEVRAAPPREHTEPDGAVADVERAVEDHLRLGAVRDARRPPPILVAGPQVADVRQHLAGEERRVVEREVLRHRADLEEHHQVADAEALDALGELGPHRGRTPGDDVALVEVLLTVERLADLLRLGADLRLGPRLERLHRPVARRLGEALPDAETLLAALLHVRVLESFRLRHRGYDARALESSFAHLLCDAVHRGDYVPSLVLPRIA